MYGLILFGVFMVMIFFSVLVAKEALISDERKCHDRILSLIGKGHAVPADLRYCATVRPREGEQ